MNRRDGSEEQDCVIEIESGKIARWKKEKNANKHAEEYEMTLVSTFR
jgi:hypothetical protein